MKRITIGLIGLMILLSWNVSNANAQGSIAYPLGRVLFTIDLPYQIDCGGVNIPPGTYVIRDLGVPSQNLLSFSCPDLFQSVALVYTTRRQLMAGREDCIDPKLVFEDENAPVPVLKELVVPGLDDYEILTAVATDNVCCAANPCPAALTVTRTVVQEQPAPPPQPAPQPQVTPPPPQPQPTPPPPPVKERKRVRKD